VSLGEVSLGEVSLGEVIRGDVLRPPSRRHQGPSSTIRGNQGHTHRLREAPSLKHLRVIRGNHEAINDTHRLREAPSLKHLRLRRPQQLPRLLALIRSLGERGRERLLMPPDEGRNQGSSSAAIKGH
jgi:hypothetical protein